jgi:hypothetical protein
MTLYQGYMAFFVAVWYGLEEEWTICLTSRSKNLGPEHPAVQLLDERTDVQLLIEQAVVQLLDDQGL